MENNIFEINYLTFLEDKLGKLGLEFLLNILILMQLHYYLLER